MRFQIVSDLHTEFYIKKAKPEEVGVKFATPDEADYIILAGDIASKSYAPFFKDYLQEEHFDKRFIYVMGNHEYYGGSFPGRQEKLRDLFKDSNVTLLEKDVLDLEEVIVVGTMLWSALPENNYHVFRTNITDFDKHTVKSLSPAKWDLEHERSVDYLNLVLADTVYKDKKKVVVTHCSPSYMSEDREMHNIISPFWHSDLSELILDREPDLWVHGHTHSSKDYFLGKTRIVCNPFGYQGYATNKKFNPNLIIEV